MNSRKVKAIIKFNSGNGALLCNNCNVIITLSTDHDKYIEHFCKKCKDKKNG